MARYLYIHSHVIHNESISHGTEHTAVWYKYVTEQSNCLVYHTYACAVSVSNLSRVSGTWYSHAL